MGLIILVWIQVYEYVQDIPLMCIMDEHDHCRTSLFLFLLHHCHYLIFNISGILINVISVFLSNGSFVCELYLNQLFSELASHNFRCKLENGSVTVVHSQHLTVSCFKGTSLKGDSAKFWLNKLLWKYL